MRLALFPKTLERVTGLDLVILEPEATVTDLADAFGPYAGCDGALHKRKLSGSGPCRACVNSCCTTSIIAPDPISFDATAHRLGLRGAAFLQERCDPDALISGMVRLRSFPCTFLSPEGLCTIYEERSLICHYFICCPYTPALETLVHNILGAGLAALVRRLRSQGLLPPESELIPPDSAASDAAASDYEAEFHRFYHRWIGRPASPASPVEEALPPAWFQNPFDSARQYSEIPLSHFVTPEQWQELTRGALTYPVFSPASIEAQGPLC